MEIDALIRDARKGEYPLVSVLTGAEKFLIDRALVLLRKASIGDGPTGFNDDVFHGKGLTAQAVLGTARTLPMMASARFVLVRGVDSMPASELEKFVDYLGAPSPSTCLVMLAGKLDGRGKFAKALKKQKCLYEAKALKFRDVERFVRSEADSRGHRMDGRAASALVDALGTDLSAVDDALERLSLYVGEGKPIDADAVSASVTKIRVETIWALVDAVSLRDKQKVMRAAGSLLADREPPLRILAMVARQLRMVAKMRQALKDGMRGPDAAKAAGAPPFKARDLTEAARRFNERTLRDAFVTIRDTDLSLKGDKRPGNLVLEEGLLRLCR